VAFPSDLWRGRLVFLKTFACLFPIPPWFPPLWQSVRVRCVDLIFIDPFFLVSVFPSALWFLCLILGGSPSLIDLLSCHTSICQCWDAGHPGSHMCRFRSLPVRVGLSADTVPIDLHITQPLQERQYGPRHVFMSFRTLETNSSSSAWFM
jgi:hypothetical protein